MNLASQLAAIAALTWATFATLVAVAITLKRRALGRARAIDSSTATSEQTRLLLRPCRGAEPGLLERLLSAREAKTASRLNVWFLLSSQDDAAMPAARRAREELEKDGIACRVLINGDSSAANDKAGKLIRAWREAASSYDVLINADSDVSLAGFDLDQLVSALSSRDAGASWCPPVDHPAPRSSLATRAVEAVSRGSMQSFALLCGVDPDGLVGKLFAIKASAIAQLGDLSDLEDYLGEDARLSLKLRNAGLGVTPVPLNVVTEPTVPTLRQAFGRYHRWIMVIRSQRLGLLLTYPLFFFPGPFITVLAVLSFPAVGSWASAAITTALMQRLLVSTAARYYSNDNAPLKDVLLDVLLADLVLGGAWLRSLYDRHIEWRGRRLTIDRKGRLRRGQASAVAASPQR